MKRRKLGMLTGASLAMGAFHKSAAQSMALNSTLLSTTLTPLGAERAGNSDGSIPSWTGGMQAPAGSPININPFSDEQPIIVITASNMAQYQSLLTEGIQAMITKFNFKVKVYPTHRTASAPKYVYDNTVKNLQTAKLNPSGGRLGFLGAYGGVPFPIPDTSDPFVAGAQIIWNHLTRWSGFCVTNKYSVTYAASGGTFVLSEGVTDKARYPYYDPNGSLENFGGYLSLTHSYYSAPAILVGQEDLLWHTTNTQFNSDIVWTLVTGQGRVRKAPDEQFDTPLTQSNGVENIDEIQAFSGRPEQYDWKFLGKQEMYVPYNNNNLLFTKAENALLPRTPNPEVIRFEKHRVWVIEATLHPGYRNVLPRRRFYLDEDTWGIRLGDCYDEIDRLVKVEMNFARVVPVLPGTIDWGFATVNLLTEDYAITGQLYEPSFSGPDSYEVLPMSNFDAQQMAAGAGF